MKSFLAVALAFAVGSCDQNVDDKPSDQAMIMVARDAVKARLRDPSSAEFKNERIGHHEGKAVVVCGEVNSKNGFGGMGGFERFMSNGDEVTRLESEMEGGSFQPVWDAMGC